MTKSTQPTFSIVFITWNPGDSIINAIQSVLSQSISDYEIVVVDNNSSDGTVERIRNEFLLNDAFQIIENDGNYGFSKGMNIGIGASKGQFIGCYNHDTILQENYLEILKQHIHDNAVWTTARVNYRVSSVEPTVRLLSRFQFTVPYAVRSLSGRASVNYVPGDGVVIPRRIYRNVLDETVFDPSLPPRAEDVDLSLRLEQAGVDMFAILDTVSKHPDKDELYKPNLKNFLNLCQVVHARTVAHWKNGRLVASLVAIASVMTTPLIFYSKPIPRSTTSFLKRTTVEEA